MIKYIFKTILIFTGLIFLVSPVFATSVAAEKTTEVGNRILQKLEVNPSLASKIVGSADDISKLSPEDTLKALEGIQRTGKVFDISEYFRLRQLGQLSDDVDSWFSWGRVNPNKISSYEITKIDPLTGESIKYTYSIKEWSKLDPVTEQPIVKDMILSQGKNPTFFNEMGIDKVKNIEGIVDNVLFELKTYKPTNGQVSYQYIVEDIFSKSAFKKFDDVGVPINSAEVYLQVSTDLTNVDDLVLGIKNYYINNNWYQMKQNIVVQIKNSNGTLSPIRYITK